MKAINGLTLTEKGIQKKGILLSDKIIKVSNKEVSAEETTQLEDNQLLLPAIMNWHAHFRDLRQRDRETIRSGSNHMLRTGVLEAMAMPNTNPPLDCDYRIRLYQDLINGVSLIPIRIHALLTPYSKKPAIDEISTKYFKVYLGKSVGPESIFFGDTKRLEEQLKLLPKKSIVSMHLELGLREYEHLWNPKKPISHYHARPNKVELDAAEYVNDKLAPEHPTKELWACHVSTKELTELRREENFHLEFTPHYAYFNKQDFNTKSYLIKCNPSIKREEDREAIEQGLRKGLFERWGDDHAPHTAEDKWGRQYSGIPSYSGGLLGHFIKRAGPELDNILKMYTRPEWMVEEGNLVRLMVLNLEDKMVKPEDLHTKARSVAPWIGEELPCVEKIYYEEKTLIFQ